MDALVTYISSQISALIGTEKVPNNDALAEIMGIESPNISLIRGNRRANYHIGVLLNLCKKLELPMSYFLPDKYSKSLERIEIKNGDALNLRFLGFAPGPGPNLPEDPTYQVPAAWLADPTDLKRYGFIVSRMESAMWCIVPGHRLLIDKQSKEPQGVFALRKEDRDINLAQCWGEERWTGPKGAPVLVPPKDTIIGHVICISLSVENSS